MIPLNQTRRIEIFLDGVWHPIQLSQLTENDVVRYFEGNKALLVDGHHVLVVRERPALSAVPVPAADDPDCNELTSDGKINGVYVDQPVPLGMVRRALNSDGADLAAFVIKRNAFLRTQGYDSSPKLVTRP